MAGHRKWREIRVRHEPEVEADIAAWVDRESARIGDGLRRARLARKRTQAELAAQMAISQAQVSNLEHQADVLLSTLRKYVESLGGRLEITAVFDGAEVPITFGPLTAEASAPPLSVPPVAAPDQSAPSRT